ncbi:MAG: tail fiber domain-containing protein, partial [Candidatus Saccharibacteria bacterium]|nr:tail fiber domain-containing protein [Candidatus Saccharibacteria bacterium]
RIQPGTNRVEIGESSGITATDRQFTVATNGTNDGVTIGQSADNTSTIQAYIDGQWAGRVAYASGCCNGLLIQPDVGYIILGNNTANGYVHSPGTTRFGADRGVYGSYQVSFGNYTTSTGWSMGQGNTTGNFGIVRSADGLGPYQQYAAPSATWSYTSDKRLKTNINSLPNGTGLSVITQLNPVTFNWISTTSPQSLQTGFIAQDVQKVLPNIVSLSGETIMTLPDGSKKTIPDALGLGQADFIPYMVKAIQEQQIEIENLQTQIDELKELIKSK